MREHEPHSREGARRCWLCRIRQQAIDEGRDPDAAVAAYRRAEAAGAQPEDEESTASRTA